MKRRDFGKAGLLGLAGLAIPAGPRNAAAQPAAGNGYRYIHLDVFTDRRLQGNQLFVFVLSCATISTLAPKNPLLPV